MVDAVIFVHVVVAHVDNKVVLKTARTGSYLDSVDCPRYMELPIKIMYN